MDLLIIAVLGILAIAAASQLSDRIGVAPALILLAGGTAVGFLPFIPAIELDPQVVLEGVLPPLLFSTAVSISTINFRRELAPVAVLAILLVALSAAVIGVALALVVPGLSLAWAIAMGAILSPTDAVAISIARRLGVSQRIITVLEGEGLLNDATALVLLSSAVSAATSGGISIGSHKAHIATMQPRSGAAGRPEMAHFSSSTSGSIRLHIWWARTCRHPPHAPQAVKPNPSPPNLQPNYWNDSAQGEGEGEAGLQAGQSQARGCRQGKAKRGPAPRPMLTRTRRCRA